MQRAVALSPDGTRQLCSSSFKGSKAEASVDDLDVRYVEDVLYSMYEDQNEHSFANFSDGYIKYRRVVAKWMIDVAEYFHLHPTTTHAAICYLDRLQPNDKFTRFEWQMMAICCILISGKYNECEEHLPPLHKLEEITQQVMTNECVLNYELWALKRMAWKLNARTPIAFLESFISLGRGLTVEAVTVCDADKSTPRKPLKSIDASLKDTSFYSPTFINQLNELATMVLLDFRFKAFKSSATACAILYYCRESQDLSPVWYEELSEITLHDPQTSQSVQAVLQMLDLVTGRPQLQTPVPPHKSSTLLPADSSSSSAEAAESPATQQLYRSSNIDHSYDSIDNSPQSVRVVTPTDKAASRVSDNEGDFLRSKALQKAVSGADKDDFSAMDDLQSDQTTPTAVHQPRAERVVSKTAAASLAVPFLASARHHDD